MTLANKYRPTDLKTVVGQEVVCKVLNKQVENNSYSHAILFSGNAGCGKTTCARIFANEINGDIIELDCATHNGVAEIKDIVDNARNKSLIHNYKVFILDECQCLTSQAWSSLLIVLEENIKHSIFIFCTTDAQKIPNTIISRVQRFNFLPIRENVIIDRLKYVCNNEHISFDEDGLKYIANSANGNLRQALTNLDKCILYDENINRENVCKALNIVTYDVLSNLYNAFSLNDRVGIIDTIENVYRNGYNLHQFVRQFLDYALKHDNLDLIERLLVILQDIRYDDMPKNIIIARLIIGGK